MADTDALENLLKIKTTKPSMLLRSLDSDSAGSPCDPVVQANICPGSPFNIKETEVKKMTFCTRVPSYVKAQRASCNFCPFLRGLPLPYFVGRETIAQRGKGGWSKSPTNLPQGWGQDPSRYRPPQETMQMLQGCAAQFPHLGAVLLPICPRPHSGQSTPR